MGTETMTSESESLIKKRVQLAVARLNCRTFNNPVGYGYIGRVLSDRPAGTFHIQGYPMHFGLHKGSPDLVGWRRVTITPEMVGRQVAIFVGIETKTATGRLSPEQKLFLDQLSKDGALCGVARSPEDAIRIVSLEV